MEQIKAYVLEQLKKVNLFQAIIFCMIAAFAWQYLSNKAGDQRHTEQLINALQDTVKVHQDRYGDRVSQISQLQWLEARSQRGSRKSSTSCRRAPARYSPSTSFFQQLSG